jgi:4a-hydroxytetrahydrobiopterin dehydratase
VGIVAGTLDAGTVASRLSEVDGWAGDTAGIARMVELASFPAAIAVVDRVAEVAEELDHHPDIDIRWRTLRFAVATHSAGGVTDKDFTLAARIDAILAAALSEDGGQR